MLIKVCGMREPDNIRAIEPLVDYMGFIFYDKSPRYVPQCPSYLPTHCQRVGVFVNTSLNTILEYIDRFMLDVVQLHGKEDEVFCQMLHTRNPHVKIWKAISIATEEDIRLTEYYTTPECFIFDTHTSQYGGSGRHFDWSLLAHYDGDIPFFLSGGLSPTSLEQVQALHHPRLIGYDLNSGFEHAPALKDTTLLAQYIPLFKQL